MQRKKIPTGPCQSLENTVLYSDTGRTTNDAMRNADYRFILLYTGKYQSADGYFLYVPV